RATASERLAAAAEPIATSQQAPASTRARRKPWTAPRSVPRAASFHLRRLHLGAPLLPLLSIVCELPETRSPRIFEALDHLDSLAVALPRASTRRWRGRTGTRDLRRLGCPISTPFIRTPTLAGNQVSWFM